MKNARFLDVGAMALVGGATCLDFVNTTGARASRQPRERLQKYSDVATWSRRAGIAAGHVRRGSARALQRTRDIRETLYRVFRALADRRTPARKDVRELDRLSREDRLRRELVITRNGAELKLSRTGSAHDQLISAVVDSAVTLLQSERLGRLKRCAECDWLFLDETRNRSRTWCKKACGDRVRARRHYRARRASRRSQAADRISGVPRAASAGRAHRPNRAR